MAIYQKILKGKVKFPRSFDSNAKSLVKHLLTSDLTKRFGNMKAGVNDIKSHRFFSGFDWVGLLHKSLQMRYIPDIKSPNDSSNFSRYPDSLTQSPIVKRSEDPFIDW